ncbi:hypothetical protein JMA_06120 [Jeotgalibacillus malaysiensis]|uniref:Uncharacterized protein n=1 Tax=Jeotgalibacillus malaysiensis TaxID=1508404 RepID=A0A0B5APD0_9BACL|nr:hypothetical protein [Jeotgalibacillus malaysiensis]AJD89929.1 hypothetical protein JMA_06120 [Jeotgalibacillus malaysiensis]
MNPYLLEILERDCVRSLPPFDQALYTFVTEVEEEIAAQCETKQEFLQKLVQHSPHTLAAEQFDLTFEQVMMRMKKIEIDIDEQINQKLQRLKWEEKTPVKRHPGAATAQYFLLTV